MDLLPFLREASEYSSIITVALYGLLSLQFKFQASKIKQEFDKKTNQLERSEDERHNRIDRSLSELNEAISDKLHLLEKHMLERFGDHGERISRLEAGCG